MLETIFSTESEAAYSLPKSDPAFHKIALPKAMIRSLPPALPQCSELDLTRHFTRLTRRSVGIDTTFYPLGSCTMKLNPRCNEQAASLPGFTRTHPLAPDATVQGNLCLIFQLIELLKGLTGMDAGTLVPSAGAQGEFVGVQMIHAYHEKREDQARLEMLIPDNAHGTNPASAKMAGFRTVSVVSGPDGDLDLDDLRAKVSEKTAGLMLTNPNTVGIFSRRILDIAEIVHGAGGLLYYDGANLNPILNVARVGEMGFDVMHINLHKTFSTPHGGGGPGSGPVLCKEHLADYLPIPRVEKQGNSYTSCWSAPETVGQIATFHGNFGIYLRAYLYARLHGNFGLRRVAEMAVLSANYLKHSLKDLFKVPYPQHCMHEFVLQADRFINQGIRALDIAKRLLDYGIHAPTVYFPLIVQECLLIEPTECESLETLDRFVTVMRTIVGEIEENPQFVKTAPHNLAVGRLDEVKAATDLVLSIRPSIRRQSGV